MTVFDKIGNTPLFKIDDKENDIYLKYEGINSFGSSKDRAAFYVLNKLYEDGKINKETTIIESSSGNMGIALAMMCKKLGNKFICVIDPHISPINEYLIRMMGAEIIKVIFLLTLTIIKYVDNYKKGMLDPYQYEPKERDRENETGDMDDEEEDDFRGRL